MTSKTLIKKRDTAREQVEKVLNEIKQGTTLEISKKSKVKYETAKKRLKKMLKEGKVTATKEPHAIIWEFKKNRSNKQKKDPRGQTKLKNKQGGQTHATPQ